MKYLLTFVLLLLNFHSLSGEGIRLSYKVILDPNTGERPEYASNKFFDALTTSMNSIMCALDSDLYFSAEEVIEIGGINHPISFQYYTANPHIEDNIESLEFNAENNPTDYAWRENRINFYFNNGGIGGICSFSFLEGANEAILIGGKFRPGIAIHEIGHFFDLCHTQGCPCGECATCDAPENDLVFDTVEDRACWDRDDIAINAFSNPYKFLNPIQKTLVDNTFNNVMSYRPIEFSLTIQQLIKWKSVMRSEPSRKDVVYSLLEEDFCQNGNFCPDAIEVFSCASSLHYYDNNVMTNSDLGDFSCYDGTVKDIWFKTIPSNPNITVKIAHADGGLRNMVMQVYKGSCENLIEIGCDDGFTSNGMPTLELSGLSPQDYIYIRLTDVDADESGTFNVFVSNNSSYGSAMFSTVQSIQGDHSDIFDNPPISSDFDGDGITDILFYGQDWKNSTALTLRTKFSNGDGTFNTTQTEIVEGVDMLVNPIISGDYNDDGKTDIIFMGQNWNGLSGLVFKLFFANGDGTFTKEETVYEGGKEVFENPVINGDFDADGRTDILLMGQDWDGNSGLVFKTYFSNGNGSFRNRQTVLGDGVEIYENPLVVGDFDGDGKTDILFLGQNWDGHQGLVFRFLFSNGDGTFRREQSVQTDAQEILENPYATGDFNADGKTDILFMGQDWENNSGLVLTRKQSYFEMLELWVF